MCKLSGPKLTIYGLTVEKKTLEKHSRSSSYKLMAIYKFTEKVNLFLTFQLLTALKCIEAFLKSQIIHNFNSWIL